MGQTGGTQWQFIVTTGIAAIALLAGAFAVPDAGQKLWIASLMAVVSALLFINVFFFSPKRSSSPAAAATAPAATTTAPAKPASLEDKEDPALLRASGYVPSGFPHRWEKPQPDADAPFEETAAIIYDENGNWETSASVFVVLKDCAWAPGSAKAFKNRNNTDCRLETVLSYPEFQNRLSSANHLVFVGMESYRNAPKPASSPDCGHVFLTACRADRLITRTYSEYFRDDTKHRPELWELDIGYANAMTATLEWDQRRAVILGIRNRRPGLAVEDAITKVATGARVGVVKLWDYSKASTARAEHIPYGDWGTGGRPDTHR